MLGPEYPHISLNGLRAAEHFTRISPDNPDAWVLYGAVGCDGIQTVPGAPDRCRAAYRHILALDSTSALMLGWCNRVGHKGG